MACLYLCNQFVVVPPVFHLCCRPVLPSKSPTNGSVRQTLAMSTHVGCGDCHSASEELLLKKHWVLKMYLCLEDDEKVKPWGLIAIPHETISVGYEWVGCPMQGVIWQCYVLFVKHGAPFFMTQEVFECRVCRIVHVRRMDPCTGNLLEACCDLLMGCCTGNTCFVHNQVLGC